ncbi:OmpA family protein [Mucilaginibacter paludis]|uniref:OmpA/MotB domain protein n=1 Tax=Mucilaginibacter paludis DSM 18603 TaxID=714943 RepID=H1Y8X4_9SPHI|nr:OmpA family protein [Mucilaginibacter paludis]EHQ28740.1 OmpA/MotB domain protein [Mucilaginibacter paludis DSM 18603]
MKKLILSALLLMLTVPVAFAQEQLSLKEQANQLFNRFEYFKSLSYYLKLANKAKPDVKIMERIAECYRNINRYGNAEQWYARAVANTKADKSSHYYYAEVLLRNQKFELAKQQYRLYFVNDSAALAFKLSTCDSAISWMKHALHQVDNATTANSAFSDWGAIDDGHASLIFTSDRKTEAGVADNRTGNNWFKLYQFNLKSQQTMPLSIVSDNGVDFNDGYHVGPMVLNKSNDTAYITVTTEIALNKLAADKPDSKRGQKLYTRRLQLLTAVSRNGRWLVFNSFAYNNVQQYSVGNAALSPDGKLIYFSSDMPGGEGKTDLWYCEKQKDGSWGKPVNCGKTINTKDEDTFPFLSSNGTLYYASKGLPGMGGYDIYAAVGKKSEWGIPQNLKYPINSTSDDFYLVSSDGLNGFLSSNRDGGKGSDDIYAFSPNPDTIAAPPAVIVNVPRPEPKPDFVIRTIYYDLDKSFIRPDAAAELDKLSVVLKEHPALKIELSSFADSRASYSYNLALSRRRATAAVNYLVNKGVSISRVLANGYGKTHLVNQCADHVKCSEAEHQLNRRTEFKLIGNFD